MSFQTYQNYSTKVEAAINFMVNLHLLASSHLLGFYLDENHMAIKSVGYFFCKMAQENGSVLSVS